MSIFDFDDYRDFIKQTLAKMPKRGRGELSKISQHLGVHSTLLSLILARERELTLEQAYDLAAYFELSPLETDYFSLLVQLNRAGNHRYKSFIQSKLEKIKKESTQISQRFNHEKTLNDTQRSVFYSSWIYSAIRLFTSTNERGVTLEDIQERFNLPRPKIIEILNFLFSTGLVVEEKSRYLMGPQRTFLEYGSPHLVRHHSNWRIKALQQADQISENELMFTSPISISKKDFAKVRKKIADFLDEFSQTVKDSPAEDIGCLNIDFFWIEK